MHYIGEHLLPGQFGKAFIWIAFFSALITMILYLMDKRRKPETRSLIPLARGLFGLHTLSLVIVAVILYYLIFRHYFEYTYVWQYSSTTLPLKYIISCFWAGQEGSFLVWALFQGIIGMILVFQARSWEKKVMPVIAFSQIFMTSMMLGIEILSIKIGGSPFTLLRETYTNIKDSIFEHPEYLQMIGDGNGLNPLLENIWMTIHPPILFLGYALALVPFSYAIAGMAGKSYTNWIRPALPWTLLALVFLGAGILLGGAWAYVSLTFGGFWAWDPVENSSLVPWVTLVAGLHFMIISRRQRNSLMSAITFVMLSYLLVLYASFLTRSGVLAESSAHSFGDNGMTLQLLVFLLSFLALSVYFIITSTKNLRGRQQEILISKEFWMFLGSMVMIMAAFQIIFTTSIPVINQLFGSTIAPPSNPAAFYNKWQLPFVVLIAIFIGVTQFLHYFNNNTGELIKKLVVPVVLSLIILIPFIVFNIVSGLNFLILVYFVFFAIISSLYNLFFKSTKPRNLAAIITHLGFLTFVLGTVMTFSNSRTISMNVSRFD
ncbi:MAG: cytochrome c biogenesis protein CcsA, partial [Syntrophothermus sp.]